MAKNVAENRELLSINILFVPLTRNEYARHENKKKKDSLSRVTIHCGYGNRALANTMKSGKELRETSV